MVKPVSFTQALRNVVAPPRCMGCWRENEWLCSQCCAGLVRLPLACIGCAKVSRSSPTVLGGGRTCSTCRERLCLTGVVSAGQYGSPLLRRGIHWLKFKGVRACAPPLADLVADRLLAIAPLPMLRTAALLVPIPLHRQKLKQRGFNQSEDLALALAAATGIACGNILERRQATWTQTKLPPELRRQNMAGAFALPGRLPDKQYFLLVDDVTTTGSTLASAAEVLRAAGAEQVWGVTIARG